MLVGAAVFVVDFSIDGFAGQALADAWAAASPSGRADLVRAAGTVFTALGGTSLTSIAVLWGLPLVLFGRAVALEGYPSWLGWPWARRRSPPRRRSSSIRASSRGS